MKSSASFRLHAKPSIAKSPSQESKNETSSQGSSSETSKGTSPTSPSSLSNECFVPLPKELLQQPLEDFDLPNKNTFVVVASRFGKQYVYRFNKAKSLNLFGPLHPFRKAIILFITNQFFEFFILLTIIVNCIFLAIKNAPEEPEYVFAAIYTLEMIVKIIAKGLCMHKFAYLRDPWNWLDFVVVILGYVTLVPNVANLSGIRTFRVLRALRTISAVEGLKTMVNALLKSMKMLSDVLILTIFFLCIFALVGMQLFVGALRNKCVLNVPHQNATNDFFTYAKNTSVWLLNPETDNPVVCGNSSIAGKCPANYTCLPDMGINPNYGYTNFDNFGWALVTAFQLITLDYWENVYNYVLSAMGSWYVFYFVMVIFFGSFYLLNLVLAVVAVSYQQEVLALQDKEQYYNNLKGVASSYSFHGCVVPKLLRNGKSKTKSLASKCKMSFCIPCFWTKNGSKPSEQSNGHASDAESSHASTGGTTRHDTTYIEMSQLNENNNGSNESRTNGTSLDTKSSSFLSVGRGIQLRLSPDSEMISQNPQESSSDTSLGLPKSSFLRKLSAISEQSSHEGSENNVSANNHLRSKSVSFVSRCQTPTDSKSKSHNHEDSKMRTKRPTRWTRMQKRISKVVLNSVFDTVITACILINTLFLSLEYPSMDEDFRAALEIGNKVFTMVFFLEMILKLMVFGPRGYVKSRWNIFDGFIVIISVIDLMAELLITEHDSGLSVLRTFRLLRVFKLAQSWRTMNMLLSTIARSVGQLGNLTLVLGIVIYMLAVVGMQIFEEYYTAKNFDGEMPRWNFTDFWHSFMMIFRVLCGEWIEPLYDCMRVSNVWATLFFLTTLIIGNFLVLNLFLALLLNAFARESLEEEAQKKAKQKPSKFAQGVQRLSKVLRLRGSVSKPTKVIPTIRVQQDGEGTPDGPTLNGESRVTGMMKFITCACALEDDRLLPTQHHPNTCQRIGK
ncbi:sodium channel protein type 2 subunit alpha-like isoform X2 [Actinia tenebrosa]|uniref:Sodium channel protein type 2 subunit alpha-like isoform X2 n=1 Tax=Actinia tenebrosa TaxID=6105 RepID=A0A6P8IHD8_ACTTE|nr:sodium channel protein type 2 subunit alpha-like isoform X2 [Actinia tenebrosa]